jgi:YbgC/YbaW family acyl-CoA thioester hydrolase
MLSQKQPLILRFADADPAGVVFYPRAIAIAHDAVEDLIRASTLGWAAWFASPIHVIPLRQAEAEFFRPMRPGQELTTRAAVENLGRTSVTFLVEFFDKSGQASARVRTTHVLVDKATGQPIPLTEDIRSALLSG